MKKSILFFLLISSFSFSQNSEWTYLFDGKTFNGWHQYNKDKMSDAWYIENGEIVLKSKNDNVSWGNDIVTDKSFTNFELSIEWKIPKGGNSGIFFKVNEIPEVDTPWKTGPEIQVLDNENFESLSERLSLLASEKILDNVDDIFSGKAIFKEQDHKNSTYAKKITKFESKITWDESAEKIIGKINGLYPFPGAFFLYKGERYKILKAELTNTQGTPGLLLNDKFEIGCAENSIKVLEIQRQGKKAQRIQEFMLGSQIKKGSSFV